MSFEDTLDHLMEILPVRALHHLCDEQHAFSRAQIDRVGVHDGSIADLLRTFDAGTRSEVEDACREVASAKGFATDVPDMFDRVDTYLRGGLNPLIDPVRSLLNALLVYVDEASGEGGQS